MSIFGDKPPQLGSNRPFRSLMGGGNQGPAPNALDFGQGGEPQPEQDLGSVHMDARGGGRPPGAPQGGPPGPGGKPQGPQYGQLLGKLQDHYDPFKLFQQSQQGGYFG